MALVTISAGLDGPAVPAASPADAKVRQRVDALIASGLQRARSIVGGHLEALRRLADAARRERYLEDAETRAIIGGLEER